MTVGHKILPNTPDDVCAKCSQNYKGDCCAYNLPHSDEECKARRTDYGLECDTPRIKQIRMAHFGVKYRT